MASYEKRTGKGGEEYYIIVVSQGRAADGHQIKKKIAYHPKAAIGTVKRKKEVEAFAAKVEAEVKAGKFYEGNKVTLQQFVYDVWLPQYGEKNLSISQKEQYMVILEKCWFPDLGNMPMTKITSIKCQEVLNNMQPIRFDKPLSPTTIKRRYSVLHSIFRFAYKMNIVEENPLDRCTLPKMKKDTNLHTLEPDQANRLISFILNGFDVYYPARHRVDSSGQRYSVKAYSQHNSFPLWFQTYLLLSIQSGARRGEQCALQWKDIDFINGKMTISKALKHSKAGYYIGMTKTVSGMRTISIDQACLDSLQQLHDEERKLCSALGTYWKGEPLEDFDSNFIFMQLDGPDVGKRMDPSTPYHVFKKSIAKYNSLIDGKMATAANEKDREELTALRIPDIRLHDLRHTSATILLSNGAPIEAVKQRLGHSNASVTLNVYGHALEEDDRKASDTLARVFDQAKRKRAYMDRATVSAELTPEEAALIRQFRESRLSQ